MKKFQIANPTTVTASIQHLITVCHRDDKKYSDNLSIVVGYMSEYISNFDSVSYLLVLRKRHETTIKSCMEICKDGHCTDEFCFGQVQKALKEIVEPFLPTLGKQTKGHLLTLAKEVPHMEAIFMEFHNKIAA